ncbi:MAG: thioesterase family protein [Pelagimonas sp.]|jgi:acyl-CoA thioesterase FadM|nr:thioesterase family protein [Pelagimonas sp.]
MYPFIRMIKEVVKARRQPPMSLLETHVSHLMCWPWDLDIWMELNNGRTLTIYDLGRIPLAQRTGLVEILRDHKWGLTVAGSVVRYRKRVRMFDKLTTYSRTLGWDARFVYLEQSMWNSRGDCTSHAVYRTAVTDKNGIVTPDRVMGAMNLTDLKSPDLPDWVQDWIKAEDKRPWPPEKSTVHDG